MFTMTKTPAARRLATLGVLLLAGQLASGCANEADRADEPTATPSASESTSPAESPSESATESPGTTSFVYYVVDTRTGLRLAREPRQLAGDAGVAAVQAMIEGPQDPDYATTWNPETEVLGVSMAGDSTTGDTITVDLSEEARTANVGSPGAALMIQQLVWTASEALDPQTPVQLLIEGQPAGELWGAVAWDEPIAREDPNDVRLLVGIDSPAEGASVTSPVTVAGEANAFEANVPWRVLDQQGNEVETGFTMTAEGMTFAPYSFTVELEPGTWTIEVLEDDPSGGEGGEPMSDSRTVTVE